MLDRLIAHLSCLDGAAGIGSAAMQLSVAMLVDVEEVVVAVVVGALGAADTIGDVCAVVTTAVLLVWSLELVFTVFFE